MKAFKYILCPGFSLAFSGPSVFGPLILIYISNSLFENDINPVSDQARHLVGSVTEAGMVYLQLCCLRICKK